MVNHDKKNNGVIASIKIMKIMQKKYHEWTLEHMIRKTPPKENNIISFSLFFPMSPCTYPKVID